MGQMALRSSLERLLWSVFLLMVFPLSSRPQSPPSEPLSWPSPPEQARIRLLKILPDGLEEKPKSSWLENAFRLLVGLDEISGASAKVFVRPTGVWARGSSLYVADPGTGRVVLFNLETRQKSLFPPLSEPKLPSPVGVAADSRGTVFVSDSALNEARLYAPNGRLLKKLAPPPSRSFGRVTSLALDEKRNRVYLADTGAHCIHAYDLQGNPLFSFGRRGSQKGELNFPTYLWADQAAGTLWVCDSGNFRLQAFTSQGECLGVLGEAGDRPGYLARPRGIARDSDGNLYCVDGAMETVQIFNLKGDLLLYFGESGEKPGFFLLPGGIFIDGQDRIFVADTYNARVQVFEYLREGKK